MRVLLLLLLLLSSMAARAAPGWASKPDAADANGHLFVCSGEGKTEDEALQAALGICNDKICKVCGVEIESTTVTSETLRGIDLSRKVIERCRRVRLLEPQVRAKSMECEEGRCQAFVQIFYSKQAEQAECPAYAREDFADPAACEKDVEAFRNQKGRSADSFRARARQLEAAMADCAHIDVRPTPALMALDEKLRAGLSFEFGRADEEALADQTAWMVKDPSGSPFHSPGWERKEAVRLFRPFWSRYLSPDHATMQLYAETKTLVGRLKLLRDLVANKALVFDVIEASQAADLDSAGGVERLLAALRAAPLGSQYGAPDVHFVMLNLLVHLKADVRPVADFLRTSYVPERPLPSTASYWDSIAEVLAADGRATAEEWDWGLRATRAQLCSRCLSPLLRVRDHGGPEVRLSRYFEALAALREAFAHRSSRANFGLLELLPMRDPAFVLAVEERAPADQKRFFDFELYGRVAGSLHDQQDPADQARALARWAQKAALPERDGDACKALPHRLEQLQRERAPFVPELGAAVCACLQGPLAQAPRDDKKALHQAALDQRLGCVEGP